jgi:rod shape-determining protein MreC
MRQLLRFLSFFREYLVVALLASISIILIVSNDSVPVQVLRSMTITVYAGIQSIPSAIASMFATKSEIDLLRDVNMAMMEETMQLRQLRYENKELRKLLGLRDKVSYPLVPAEIVGKGAVLGTSTLTLDAGSTDSVDVRMPVINEQGMVGKVIAVSGHFCVVQTALSRDFRVTAKLARARLDGIISWEDGQTLQLQNIWKTADVVAGDTVITSGYSSLFPPDIPIGTVASVGVGPTGLFSKIDVKPFASFSTLERVFVVRYKPDAERIALEQKSSSTGTHR